MGLSSKNLYYLGPRETEVNFFLLPQLVLPKIDVVRIRRHCRIMERKMNKLSNHHPPATTIEVIVRIYHLLIHDSFKVGVGTGTGTGTRTGTGTGTGTETGTGTGTETGIGKGRRTRNVKKRKTRIRKGTERRTETGKPEK